VPQRRSPIKELRKTRKKKMHNLDIKTNLRKSTKKFLSSVEEKNTDDAKKDLKVLFKKLDKASKRNIMHKNTAARRKSRYSKLATNIK